MTIAFVPVRIGSKSIPHKNIKDFCGKPLLIWTLESLCDLDEVDQVVVASDSSLIDEVVLQAHLPKVSIYRRDDVNAQDGSSTESVMFEYLNKHSVDLDSIFVLAQATNPFIQSKYIKEGVGKVIAGKFNSMLSCTREKRFFWSEDGVPINYDYNNRPRRQDFDGILKENGAFYISTVQSILENENRLGGKIGIVEMPEYSQVEIDEEDDWLFAEKLFKKYCLNLSQEQEEIYLVATDVDGVLTDAGMYYSEKGDELKKFNTRDGKGFELLRNHGIKTAIITSERTQIVTDRAKKLKADFLKQGVTGKGKKASVQEICNDLGVQLNNVAYIGDDINCIQLLESVGRAFCPKDAVEEVKAIPNITVLNAKGGGGAYREMVESLFRERCFKDDK